MELGEGDFRGKVKTSSSSGAGRKNTAPRPLTEPGRGPRFPPLCSAGARCALHAPQGCTQYPRDEAWREAATQPGDLSSCSGSGQASKCPRLNLAKTCATVTEDVSLSLSFSFFFLFLSLFCGDPPPPGRDSARRRPALQLSTPSPPARLPPAASLPAASPSGGCQLPAVRVTAAEGGRDAAGGGGEGDPRSRGGRSPVKSPQSRRRKRRQKRRGGKPPDALVLAAAAAPRPG